jgi:hypothetical protein
MDESAKKKVYGAVRRCLDKCFGTVSPLVQATAYLDSLRRDAQWTPQEASEVESLVLRAVRVIVRQPRTDCCQDAKRQPEN